MRSHRTRRRSRLGRPHRRHRRRHRRDCATLDRGHRRRRYLPSARSRVRVGELCADERDDRVTGQACRVRAPRVRGVRARVACANVRSVGFQLTPIGASHVCSIDDARRSFERARDGVGGGERGGARCERGGARAACARWCATRRWRGGARHGVFVFVFVGEDVVADGDVRGVSGQV